MRRYLVGDAEGYYADYAGTLQELARCIEHGWLYEGQTSPRGNRRGTAARGRPAWQFLYALQNHDQVGNRAFGERLHHQIDLDRYRAASTLLLFLPYTPMLFMGQEFAASTPFQFFTDHNPDLGRLVTQGRRKEFKAFSAFADPALRERIPDPQAESTFRNSKLRFEEADRPPGADVLRLYSELLRLRRADPVLADQDRDTLEARALTDKLLAVRRWRGADERLLIVNFADVEARVEEFDGGWQPFFDSGPAARVDSTAITLAPRSASILARPQP
jgi:maltooligosyltrehalose trehalohydrolase